MCYSLVGNSESNLLFAFASRDPRPDSNDCLPSLIDYSIPRSNVPILILQLVTGGCTVVFMPVDLSAHYYEHLLQKFYSSVNGRCCLTAR